MNNKDSKSCSFLCIKNCKQPWEDQQNKKVQNSPIFQKLSLKKIKQDHHHINRTQSYKRIQRPIPTTQRSAEQNVQKKRKIQTEISSLNNDFDKYYELYAKKLKQLKQIQIKMSDHGKDKFRR